VSEASVAGAYRRARPDEVPALVALVESAYRGEPTASAWTTEAHLIGGQRVDRDMLGAAMADPRTAVLVRVDPTGELVACCELRQLDGAVASFGMFAVSPDRQAAGVGRELLEEAERVVVREWGATRMELSVIDVRIELVDAAHESFTDVCDYQAFLPTLGDAVPALVIDAIDASAAEGCTDADMPIERAKELTNTFAINFLESVFRGGELISDANTTLPDDIIFMSR